MDSPLWQNRIVRTGDENPEDLLANPKNWRIHPKAQQDALAGVLTEIGWIAPVIVNEVTGHVIDGHLRITLALRRGETAIPVSYVQLTEEEEALALATFDPLSALAVMDAEQMTGLLAETASPDGSVQKLLDSLRQTAESALASSAPPPDLDGLVDQLDGPPDVDPYPTIKVRVTHETYEQWVSLMEDAPGRGEAEKMAAILAAVDTAALGWQG